MLQTLHIRNLALVTALDLEFGPGVNAMTGETGARKSLIIGALQLLLGERAGAGLIRRGAERCEIAATVGLGPGFAELQAEIDALLAAAGAAACTDGELLLRRVITESGSRAFVNGSPVTLQTLKQLGDLLIDLHGPHEHQSLLQPRNQLALLDAFAGCRAQAAACAQAWQDRRALEAELAAARAASDSRLELELLEHQVAEIDAAGLSPDEEATLAGQHRILSHAQRLLELAYECRRGLTEADGSVVEQLSQFVRALQELADIDPDRGESFAACLEESVRQLQELSLDLDRYGDSLDPDEARLQELEARLAQIRQLKRKYGATLAAVLEAREAMAARLAAVSERGARIQALEASCRDLEAQHTQFCAELSAARRPAAGELAAAISAKLHRLGFAQAQFAINVASTDLGPRGADQIEFCFAPNPGEPAFPLRKIASSGEIARVMLAVKTVLSTADNVPILIFDEVDANVGGLVAVEVADELKAIAVRHQVFCITHLPQIAAAGDLHFRVVKHVKGKRTVTAVTRLDAPAREQEITRMLGSTTVSATAVKHARELLDRGQVGAGGQGNCVREQAQ